MQLLTTVGVVRTSGFDKPMFANEQIRLALKAFIVKKSWKETHAKELCEFDVSLGTLEFHQSLTSELKPKDAENIF